MRYLPALCALASFFFGAASLQADEAKALAEPTTGVSIEILVADIGSVEKGEGEPDEKAVIARVRELEKRGQLTRVTRLRLTTLSNQVAMVQFGERAPMATGRTPSPFAGGGRAGGPGSGGDASTSYIYQNIGTLAEITPQVAAGKVTLFCKVDQSRITPRKPTTDKPEATFEPGSVETITARSVVQVKSGDTALLASRQSASGDESTRTYVFVTATILE